MATHRRALSPTSPRVVLEGPRASTGAMPTTFENRYDSSRPIRASFSTVPASTARNNSVYETQPVSKRTYVDGNGTVSRTEYMVRERRDSAAADSRRPLTVLTKNSVSPTREHYTQSPRDMVPYKPHKDDTAGLLTPTQHRGSAHHQRHNSATRAEAGRYFGVAQTAPRVERAYHNRGAYVEKVADSRSNLPRYPEEPTYEYTGPREQFDRDYPATTRARRESLSRRERPGSAFEPRNEASRRETAPPSASRQLARVERDDRKSGFESDPDRSRASHKARRPSRGSGPVVHQRDEGYSSSRDDYDTRRPPNKYAVADDVTAESGRSRYKDSQRDFERETERHKDRDVNKDRERERERERERPRRAEREEEIPADRDKDRERRERRPERPREREYEHDRDRDRDRERDRERDRPYHKDYEAVEEDEPRRRHRRKETRDSRDPSPEHSGLKALATAAIGGLAVTGIAKSKSGKDEEQSDSDKKGERRHRRRKARDPRDTERPDGENEEARRPRRERRSHKDTQDDSSGSDTPEDESTRKRPQSRTRQRRDTRDEYASDREKPQLALPAPEMERRPSRDSEINKTREAPMPTTGAERKQDSPVNAEDRTTSLGEGEDGRPRRVSIVEPVRDRKEDTRPRGILKKPREVPFPEDPNPQREGVAPLKQAGKEGIPPGARWTKVSRILVNPEALEKSHLRFEEREDYVIVLKVLSREEIEKLAERTREIREHREREWRKQAANAPASEHETRSDGDYDEHRAEPLAIEAPPTGPPTDLRQLTGQNNVPQQQPQYAYPPQQQYQQQQQQPYPPQQYAPQQWQNPESARTSAEAIAATAPGQPLPNAQHQQQPQQFDTGMYSQNV